MKRLLPILTVFILTVGSNARLGETMEQAVARYGPVIKETDSNGIHWYAFRKNGFIVRAIFQNSKIVQIDYSHDFTVAEPNQSWMQLSKLSDVEIQNFLKVNDTGPWTKLFVDGYGDWESANNLASYTLNSSTKDVMRWFYELKVYTKDWQHQLNQKKAAEETANQQGF
jgi:hypothetical protein